MRRERFLPGAGQADLPDRGGGLLFLQPQGAARQPEGAAGQRDGAGGDQHDFLSLRPQGGDVGRDGGEPGALRRRGLVVHHQGGADLDDDAPRRGEGRGGGV